MQHTAASYLEHLYEEKKQPKILFYGSSNTARCNKGAHWGDCLEVGLYEKFGGAHRSFNMGVSGNTSRDLLQRFSSDVAAYKPDLVILTIGGNDSNPAQEMSETEFHDNLIKLHRDINNLGAAVLFQTYYAPNKTTFAADHLPRFHRYMQIIREVAQETSSFLHDSLTRWINLQNTCPQRYAFQMYDALHLNSYGNRVFGLDLARFLGCSVKDDPYWERAKTVQALMDALETTS